MKKIIVTRHAGLIEYIKTYLPTLAEGAEVVPHAKAEEITGAHVIGPLPLHLACLCAQVTEIPLVYTDQTARGKELSMEEVAQMAQAPVTYVIRKVPTDVMHVKCRPNELW